MINAKEFRVGNLLNSHDGITVVTGHDIEVFSRSMASYPEHPGIHLTHEWLLKLGFERESELWYSLGIVYIRKHQDKFQFYFGSQGPLGDLEYVHQLQNFCFSVTGRELKLYTP